MTDSKTKAEVETASDSRNTVTVKLDEPFKRGQMVINQVVLTRPKGGALRGLSLSRLMNEADVDEQMKLIERISEPKIFVADLDNGDLAPSDLMQLVSESSLFFVPKSKRQAIEQTV